MLHLDVLEPAAAGGPPRSDALKLCTHRPEVYGEPFLVGMQDVMQGPSPWNLGERELFAAYTSALNHCAY